MGRTMLRKVLLAALAAALPLAVLAQAAPPARPDPAATESLQAPQAVPSRPSVPSTPSTAALPGDASAEAAGAQRRPPTGMLGAGAFGDSSTGLENVLNSGTPPAWDRRAGTRKVCPPELENRNNVCVAPMGTLLTR